MIAGVMALVITLGFLAGPSSALTADSPCGVRVAEDCGGASGDQVEGDFHGLIMVPGRPGVLDRAAHSGTKPGCGDCEWTLILACLQNSPDNPNNQNPCVNVTQSQLCTKGQSLFRLYLTTDDVRNALVDTLCLGGADKIVPVGDIAATDVRNYLRDVRPPEMRLRFQPPDGAIAGLPAYFMVRPPSGLRPQPFGGPQVTETITITPARFRWSWGDGSDPTLTDDPGAPYPDGTLTHTYTTAGDVTGALTTDWTATYTITVAGQTFGPYDAAGAAVSRDQTFSLAVDAAHSHLVSGSSH